MKRFDAIIVGAGMAGLTAATYLARAGRSVLLLEKNEKPGGLVSTFEKNGFLFEGGVRALVNAGIVLPMLRELGIEMETVPSPVSVGVEDQILHVSGKEDLEAYAALLKRLYPESIQDIHRLTNVLAKVTRDMEVLYAVENPAFRGLFEDKAYFFKTYLPWMSKFLGTLYAINHMRGPVEPFLEKIVANRSLRDIVSQHFFRGTPSFFALSYFYLYGDYVYPRGGMGQLAAKVAAKAAELGVELHLQTRVTALDVSQRLVTVEDGTQYQYGDLVWAADLKTLYRIAQTDGLPASVVQKIETKKAEILSKRGADSVFTVYLGVDEPPETFRRLAHGHFFYTPSRQGLGEIHTTELRRMLDTWERVTRADVLAWLDRFSALNTYEISIPAFKEPQAAPPGKTGLIISTLFEYDLVKRVQADGWYEEFCEAVANRMVQALAKSVYPVLSDPAKILFRFTATPLTIAHWAGSSEGAIVGWSFEDKIPVTNSLLRINAAPKTEFPHVVKAGQWAYSPTGVPTAVLTGRLAAKALGA
ncbi:MAG: NAD(P)/FAD-dependent oxidoreductase [Anaerolineales bacterium]